MFRLIVFRSLSSHLKSYRVHFKPKEAWPFGVRKDGAKVSALHAAKNFPYIKRWLLVGRFAEGPRLIKGVDSG